MPLRSLAIVATFAATLAAAPAQAGIIFSDNFNADNGVSVLNFNGLLNWTVGNGTIDYIRSGTFGINCVGGSGGCLDMDGSTRDAGRITSKQVFTFAPGDLFSIDMTLSGSQRGGASDTVNFGLVNVATGSLFGAAFGPLAPNAPFSVFTTGFAGSAVPGQWRLYVEGVGGDNIGAILDNYVLRDNRVLNVPEPTTLLLTALGLLAAAGVRRRSVAEPS